MKNSIGFAFVLASFAAANADAAMTGIFRTSSPGGTATEMKMYTSVSTLASNSSTFSPVALTPTIADARYVSVFVDFTSTQQGYVYKSLYNASGRISQIVRYSIGAAPAGNMALENFRTNTGGTVFNLAGYGATAGWDREDDFFADGLGNYYRNRTVSGGSNGVTKYTSFADFVAGTNGTTFNYGVTYGYQDRFFGFEGKFYRTNTNSSNSTVLGFAVYNSFSDLVSGTVAQTISSNGWSTTDLFIPVPTPGTMALTGMGLLTLSRRRR